MANRGVAPENAGRDPELVDSLQDAERKGMCAFSVEAFQRQILQKIGGLVLAVNAFPYANTQHHFLILPERHIVDPNDLTAEDWVEFVSMFRVVREEYGVPTGAVVMRYSSEGNFPATGATVDHLHWHVVAPQLDPETGRVPGAGTLEAQVVNFKIG